MKMSRAQQLMQQWLTHRLVLEHLLELIPDEFIRYKPWQSAMALGELAQHVTASTDMFVTIAKSGEGEIRMPTITPCDTMAQVLDVVRQLTEKTKATYTSLTDAELEIEFDHPHPNFKGPRVKLLTIANDHEIHHKGQLFVYARMVGIEKLPFFI